MSSRRGTVLGLLSAGILAVYLGGYAVAYACRSPAANLAHFVYAQQTAFDRVFYVVFWPPYRVHGLLMVRTRHNFDRPAHLPTGP